MKNGSRHRLSFLFNVLRPECRGINPNDIIQKLIHRIASLMFEKEQNLIEEKVKAYCAANNIALAELKWQPIPFSGEWGIATSFFQTAANEARSGKGNPAESMRGHGKMPVPQRAQEMAEQVKTEIGSVPGISHIEAVKGYLNLYFTTSEYARRV